MLEYELKKGNGYNGYSMSNNAVMAYDEGSKPMSRWSKSIFVDEVNWELDVSIKSIKGSYKRFLSYDGWHHTSKFYNVTEFYKIDFDYVEKGIKSGEILLYTSEEIKELEILKAAAEAERERIIEEYEEERKAEEAIMIKELETAEKATRTSKKGNDIVTIFITPKEKLLYNNLKNENGWIRREKFIKEVEPKNAIKELRLKGFIKNE